MKKLYFGNLPYSIGIEEMTELVRQYAEPKFVKVMTNNETGESRGFAFVEFEEDDDADEVISALNGYEIDGRALVVNEARPPRERSGGEGRSGSGSRFGGGGRGDRSGGSYGGGGGRGGYRDSNGRGGPRRSAARGEW